MKMVKDNEVIIINPSLKDYYEKKGYVEVKNEK